MTATEVIARLELMQQLMGPALGRIMQEILNTALQRIFGIMVRARAFAPTPPQLQAYVRQYGHWDVEYQSPLARAQRLPDLAAIQRTLGLAQPMVQVKPDILDVLDLDQAVRHAADVTGVPASMIRTEAQVFAIRQQRAKQEAAIQQAQAALTVAEAAGKAAPMVRALQPTQGQGA